MTTAAQHTIILLNPAAGGGTALRKMERVRDFVEEKLGRTKLVSLSGAGGLTELVERFLQAGHRRFVAAGGDGTVNTLVRALMGAGRMSEAAQMGAIALGSSNDFHKPVRSGQRIEGISCKIDFGHVDERDVGWLRFEDEHGGWHTRHWIVNAGLGITAEANAFFNGPDAALALLKRCSTAGAIGYAALRTILRFHNEPRLVKIDSQPCAVIDVSNLGVVKSPHFAGSLCYDSGFDPCSGRFHVHLCEGMSLPETLFTLRQLSREHFRDLPKTRSWETNRLFVVSDQPFPVEYDGEIIHTKKVAFGIAASRLEVCI